VTRERRPALLRGEATQAVWIARDGRPGKPGVIRSLVWSRAEARFGKGFGPHRSRHAYATSAIDADPANPGVAAAVLAIGGTMVERRCNLGNAAVAGRLLADAPREERALSRARAEGHFRDR
jgi:hypothetical protein